MLANTDTQFNVPRATGETEDVISTPLDLSIQEAMDLFIQKAMLHDHPRRKMN